MQVIPANAWTQIEGLNSSKTYLLQAQYTGNANSSYGIFGTYLVQVYWKQSQTAPQTTDTGSIDTTLKASGSIPIYVKSPRTVSISVQEVV